MPPIGSVSPILVLDDDEIMRDLLSALLPLEGYEVTAASTGEEALQILQNRSDFDVLLTDLHMPGLRGKELAETLRSAMAPATLLIGMSGSEAPDDAENLFDAFLPKPFEVQLLRDAVYSAASGRARHDNASEGGPNEIATHSSNGADVLDFKVFDALLKMIPEAQLGPLFTMALGDIAKRQSNMVAFAETGDLAAVQREAHAMKGSCGMLGATELQHLAASIEDGTTLNNPAIAEIPLACFRLRRMLETKLHSV